MFEESEGGGEQKSLKDRRNRVQSLMKGFDSKMRKKIPDPSDISIHH